MNCRDLYAACSGAFAALAVQQLGSYLAQPSLPVAVSLVMLAFLFVATLAAHVTAIVTERQTERQKRSKTTARRKQKGPRRAFASAANAGTKVDRAA